MIGTRIIWRGTKNDDMDGEFVIAASGVVLGTGAYGKTGYEVLSPDGAVSTFRSAMQALTHFNTTGAPNDPQ